MELSEFEKSKVRFHLGINAGSQIPVGDRARVEEAMSLIPDEFFYDQILNHIRRCDVAWENSEYFPRDANGSPNYSRLEQIAGDVQRTMATSDPLKGDQYFREIYLREVDRMAETLFVPNYRRPEYRRFAFERSGSEFVMAIPGPADTAVGSRIMLNQVWR
ncbi:MAG: hypothetical protein CL681_06175 [Blastopirellula sp.]|nr:hypothetical protein [Blastopirellula sp.]